MPGVELARSYRPVVCAYLATAASYNFLICFSHPFYEKGLALVVLETLAITAVLTGCLFLLAIRRGHISQLKLELAAGAMNLVFLANVFAYQLLHFEEPKLVYFLLLGLAFAVAAPTRRLAIGSVAASTTALLAVIARADLAMLHQYAFIALAGAFAALGMSMLMRTTVHRELRARLAAEDLNRSLTQELETKRRLKAEAEGLAVAAQTANRAKSEFLATMSHEIRTPLNGVLGAAEAMQRGELPEEQRRRLSLIQASGQSLLEVINAILDISRIEAGKLELSPAPFDLDRFAASLAQLYGGLAEDKGLALSVSVAAGAGGWREGDEARLRQVTSNLISNAIKFTDRGRVDVSFTGDASTLMCTVADTGVGIPADRLPMIFDRFMQVDGSATRRIGGSGLGLAICRELLDLMGGRIEAESPPRRGARFTYSLPCPVVAVEPVQPTAVAAQQTFEQPLRALVVDDNETNRIVLETMLDHLGVACTQAHNGVEAIELWQAGRWDVILMDIHMPQMDGVQACREIRAREAGSGRLRTPVIAATASVLSHETASYMSAGFDGVVAKPIRATELINALQAAIDGPGQEEHRQTA